MNDKAYLIAEPRPEEEDESELEEEETEQQTAAAEEEEEEQEEEDDENNNNHYYNDDIDTADFASIGSSAVRLSLAHQSSSNPTTPSNINSNSNSSPPSSPSSPLATAALAAAAASASVAAAAARITAKAAHRALATGAAGSHRAIQLIDGSDGSSLASQATSSASASSSGGITDNNYTNVAVGLGAMLLNDTLLLDGNDTALSIFGDMVSGNGSSGGNASAAVNVTASKVDEDDFTQLLRMAVTSVLLGLMILVTIIGKFDMESSLGVAQTAG